MMRSFKSCVPYALSFAALFAVNLVQAQQLAAVSPAPELPSSAVASSSSAPDQAPLFQRAMVDLDARRDAVAEQAPKLSGTAQRQFLARTLSQALEETTRVETEYRDVLQVQQLPDRDSELFDAVRSRYLDAKHDVDGSGKFLHAGLTLHRNGSNTPLAETLSALSYNEHVYRSITGGMAGMFDLKVVSYPAGAKITYWESSSGEVESGRTVPSGSTISALPISVWYVRAEMPGHEPIVQTYDAYVETSGKLVFDFNQK